MITDIQRYARSVSGDTRDGLLALSGARDTEVGQAIMRAAELKMKEEQNSVMRRPRRDDADIRLDLYHRIGFTAGIAWVLDLAPSARRALLGGSVDISADGGTDNDVYDPTREQQGLPA